MNLLQHLLPGKSALTLKSWELDTSAGRFVASVSSTQAVAECPVCAHPSHRIHSHYERTLKDLSFVQFSLIILLEVGKFFCGNDSCPRRIFTERLPDVVAPWARQTLRYHRQLTKMALALGGSAAVRLSDQLIGYSYSRNTFTRLCPLSRNKWQSELLPTAEFRQLWQQLKCQFERDQAAVLMVEALYIAATYDQEQAVADYMTDALVNKQLTLARLQQQFMPSSVAALPPIETQQHALDSYDQLLSSPNNNNREDIKEDNDDSQRQPLSTVEQPAQTAQAHQHAYLLGSYREPRFTAAMVLCAIFTQLVPTRGRQKKPNAAKARQKRSTAPRRKKFNQL